MTGNIGQFIYVFSEHDKDILFNKGFMLLTFDREKQVYVFVNKEQHNFDESEVKFVVSDVISF